MSMRAALGVCAVLAAAAAARADVLYQLNTTGVLRTVDPLTGTVLTRAPLRVPGKVVAFATGLGAGAGSGPAYGLLGVGDECPLDPSRTTFVGGQGDGCEYIGSQEECDRSFVVRWDGAPISCTWSGGGCDVCGSCVNTCAPPPPCPGSSRAQWAGFGSESCRALDGDAASCGQAYYSDEFGTWSCFASADQCLACDPAAQAAGACAYDCQPSASCADPSRDVYAGIYGCERLSGDPSACQRAFQSDGGAGTMACIAGDGDSCFWCDANGEAQGFCTNTCAAPPPCSGDPARSPVPRCYVHDQDAEACAHAYTIEQGEAAACFLNENGYCTACGTGDERGGACLDVCTPAVCEADAGRTALLASPDDCHGFDADPVACEASYFIGWCGVSSCHYDAEATSCRACTRDDPGRCENACGAFQSFDPARPPWLATIDLATATATIVGSPGDLFEQPVPDGGGTVHALGRYPRCAVPQGIFRLDPGDLRPSREVSLSGYALGAIALHPSDGRLYRLASDGLFATDLGTGLTTPVALAAPIVFVPAAMTWAPACNAFLVADDFDGLWQLDPLAGTLERCAMYLEGECDEGDCTVGLVAEGTSACPPLLPPISTTTITTTSTSSSTSSTTLPSELVSGRRLLLTDDPKPRKRRLALRSDDPAITLGGGEGSADDPVVHGGTLDVVASAGTFHATYALADGWRYVRKDGQLAGYEWSSRDAVRKIVLRRGRLEVRGQGSDLIQTLFSDPDELQVVLQLGGRRWCLEFGGTFDARTLRKLRAHDAPAPQECVQP
jgi:hypothetical protein